MEHRHAQGKAQTPVTAAIPACSVLWSRAMGDKMESAYVHMEHRLCNIKGTQSSQDT